SQDGQFLAAARGSSKGIVIFSTNPYRQIQEDDKYENASFGLAFSPLGALAVVSDAGFIRLYDRVDPSSHTSPYTLAQKVKAPGGKEPFSVSFSADGSKLAIGYYDSCTISVLDANDLTYLYSPDITEAVQVNRRLNKVAFTSDGRYLVSGGFLCKHSDKWWYQIRIWEQEGKGKYIDHDASTNIVQNIQSLPNGHILYCGYNPDWGILNPDTGEKRVFQTSETNGYNSTNKTHLRANEDGTSLGFTPLDESPLCFDFADRVLLEKEADYPHYQDQTANIQLTDWNITREPKVNGELLNILTHYERALSVDISDSGSQYVLGADYALYSLNEHNQQIWSTQIQAAVWAVKITGNGKMVIGAFADGTIRWFRMEDGGLLLTFFLHADKKRWVLWTPSGYYDASPGGEELIGWHVNQGLDKEALYYPISRFRLNFYRPDVINLILETLDEEEAVTLANQEAHKSRNVPAPSILSELPPSVQITYPANGAKVDQTSLDISYLINSPNEEDITRLIIQINGRPVSTQRGSFARNTDLQTSIEIPPENCVVSVIAENRHGSSEAVSIDVFWSGSLSIRKEFIKPKLYL
ncbi:MAG: peptidase C14, partial [Bacteroidota bacterium]